VTTLIIPAAKAQRGRWPWLPALANALLSSKRFSASFWVFFAAAFLWDFGIGLYFFLFNLFLANLYHKESILGLVTGALTLGNLAGSIPMSILVRRIGLRNALLTGFVSAPLLCVSRTLVISLPMQMGLAFLAGIALSCWPVCFSPVLARLTTEENRDFGFSIVFATGIGSGTLAGLVAGHIPKMLRSATGINHMGNDLQLILLFACGVAMLGIAPLLMLRIGRAQCNERLNIRLIHPYLFRFLPPFVFWSMVTGSITPFAAVFLQQRLRISLTNVGLVFSASQLVQFAAVLLAPLLFRRLGTVPGIITTQLAAGAALLILAHAQSAPGAIAAYLGYMSVQFMSGPGIYSLLMNQLPEEERSTASAVQNIAGSLSNAAAALFTGSMLMKFGYANVFGGIAGIAVLAALLMLVLLGPVDRQRTALLQEAEAG
jgi:MFS family permease